jgi:hypothetical protein
MTAIAGAARRRLEHGHSYASPLGCDSKGGLQHLGGIEVPGSVGAKRQLLAERVPHEDLGFREARARGRIRSAEDGPCHAQRWEGRTAIHRMTLKAILARPHAGRALQPVNLATAEQPEDCKNADERGRGKVQTALQAQKNSAPVPTPTAPAVT